MVRRIVLVVVCLLLGVIAYTIVASWFINVDCREPYLSSVSPEGTDSLVVCRRPTLMAMPGQGSDAPGWIVLRDASGFITGVVDLSMLQVAAEPEWSPNRVDMPLAASFERRAQASIVQAWLTSCSWRMRAVLGLTPSDESFR